MTAPNPFVVGAVAVVVLAQVPLVAYLSRHVAVDGGAERPDASKGYVTYGTVDARPASNAGSAGDDADADGGDAVACPSCGSVVDASYDVCGACATRIPPEGPGGGERR
ncbi:hypothetical protein [Halorubellus salinus]|uniref:hypothetical protein n=1 Tax=Halorubellus salinus TaxID=755309 RepID=UPI001D090564|nr:hypothetical protein [Halorubellus salinus]